jgi:hypothetical protein
LPVQKNRQLLLFVKGESIRWQKPINNKVKPFIFFDDDRRNLVSNYFKKLLSKRFMDSATPR